MGILELAARQDAADDARLAFIAKIAALKGQDVGNPALLIRELAKEAGKLNGASMETPESMVQKLYHGNLSAYAFFGDEVCADLLEEFFSLLNTGPSAGYSEAQMWRSWCEIVRDTAANHARRRYGK